MSENGVDEKKAKWLRVKHDQGQPHDADTIDELHPLLTPPPTPNQLN